MVNPRHEGLGPQDSQYPGEDQKALPEGAIQQPPLYEEKAGLLQSDKIGSRLHVSDIQPPAPDVLSGSFAYIDVSFSCGF